MAYGLLGLSWIIACLVNSELYAWGGLRENNRIHTFRHFLGHVERNKHKGFEGIEFDFVRFKDTWFQTLSYLIRGYSLCSGTDFRNLIGILTDCTFFYIWVALP